MSSGTLCKTQWDNLFILQAIMRYLLEALDELEDKEFNRFKKILAKSTMGGAGPIPRGQLLHLDACDVAEKMQRVFLEKGAVELTVQILKEIQQEEPADNLKRNTDSFWS